MIKIYIDGKYTKVGDPFYDQDIKDWSLELLEYGYGRTKLGNVFITEAEGISVDDFLTLMSIDNGNQVGWLPFIKVNDADIDNEVPVGLDNRTYEECIANCDQDPEGPTPPEYVTVIRTWRTWRDANHPLPDPIGEPIEAPTEYNYYFVAHTFGVARRSYELLIIQNNADSELIIKEDVPVVPVEGASTTGIVYI